MSKRTILAILAIAAAGIGWYLFRPERLFINQTVSESFPAATTATAASTTGSPVALYSGRFHGVAHKTSGAATVYQLPEGKRVLRFTEFETSNGPDVQVYLIAASDAGDNSTVTRAGFISLGPMKGNRGDQNYELPADIDFSKYRAVTIWCRRFGVNFATVPLQPASMGGVATQPASPSAAPAELSAGRFHGVAHQSKGLATIYQLPGGKRVVRLTEFETSNGPELHLYLVAADDATDSDTVKRAGFVSLGP